MDLKKYVNVKFFFVILCNQVADRKPFSSYNFYVSINGESLIYHYYTMHFTSSLLATLIWFTLPVQSLNTESRTTSNNTISILTNHFQILKDLLPYSKTSKPQIKESRPLIKVLRDGVPVNFHRAPAIIMKSNKTDDLVRNSNKTMVLTEIKTITEFATTTVSPTQEFQALQINLNTLSIETSTPTFQSHDFPPITIEDTPKTLEPEESSDALQRDAFDQIKKLEKLVLDLRLEMKEQQKSFNDQLVDIYTARSIVPIYTTHIVTSAIPSYVPKEEVMVSHDTAPIVSRPRTDIPVSQRIDTISKHKMNGKNILNNNPPPNSVLIVPQFQFHERLATKTEVAYMKPKIVWTNFPTTTATSMFDNFILKNLVDETDSEIDSGETELSDDYYYYYSYEDDGKEDDSDEITAQILLSNSELGTKTPNFEDPFEQINIEDNKVISVNTPKTKKPTTTVFGTSTSALSTFESTIFEIPKFFYGSRRKQLSSFKNKNSTIKFDVFDWIFESGTTNEKVHGLVLVSSGVLLGTCLLFIL